MTFFDGLLLAFVLIVSIWIGWRSRPGAWLVLFASALLVSAALFLPTSVLIAFAGRDSVSFLEAMIRGKSPWDLSEAAHLIAFLWIGLVLWWFRPDLRGWRRIALLVGLAVGAELTQGLTPGRTPRVADVGINLLGAAISLVLAKVADALWMGLRRLQTREASK
ncbi:VanZ family protein [Lysobacter sp. F6437]|uniref:VanZ family protein n=1 Tax=Lysobacter sp. F6437 TaxID=3459296 RepID=UPI00403DAB95